MTVSIFEVYTFVPGVPFEFPVRVVSQADTKLFKATPTLAAGDVKIDKDFAGAANVTALPVFTGALGKATLTAAETTGVTKWLTYDMIDVAGAEWCSVSYLFVPMATGTVSSHTAADIWSVGARTLTSYGTLVADTATAVWASGTRTLTSFGTLVADIWAYATRTLTSYGTLIADIWSYATRTLTSYGTLVSDTATAVWASGTRTLTSYGTLIADIWTYVTRTLTSGGSGATAAEVWAYTTRTLTQTITSITAAISGTKITIQRGDTVTISVTGLGSVAAYVSLDFSVKNDKEDLDADALIRVRKNLSGVGDGLLRLNGEATTAAWGTIVVDDAAAGNITITVEADATKELRTDATLYYDIQMITATTTETLSSGDAEVVADITRLIT